MKSLFTSMLILSVLVLHGQVNWQTVGAGVDDNVYDLQKFQNRIYAGGKMEVAYWNDTAWTYLPPVFGMAYPLGLAAFNDTLYVNGGVPWSGTISNVYKYNGTDWIQVGGDFDENSFSSTYKLFEFNNELYAGGRFTYIDGSPINNIAKWNGSSWENLGNGLNHTVYDLVDLNDTLYASGSFYSSGSDQYVQSVAYWDGLDWFPLDSNESITPNYIKMMVYDSTLIMGNVWDTLNGYGMKGVAQWNGSSFYPMGSDLIHNVENLWVYNNELYMAASLYTLGPNYEYVVLKWNGFFWQYFGNNFDDRIMTIDDYNGDIFCAGFFDTDAGHVAKLLPTANIEESASANISVYPNPCSNHVYASSFENIERIWMFNLLGELVLTKTLNLKSGIIDIDHLQTGTYILKIKTTTQLITEKLIVEKN